MNPPWANKSGLSKATAILATILCVSLGLCGANFALVMTASGSATGSTVLAATGVIELIGIAVGILGLILVGVIAIVRSLTHRPAPPSEEEKQ